MLVFYEKVPRHFWRIILAIVTQVLPSRDSEIRGQIVRIIKINTILKRPLNELFAVEIHIMTLITQIRQVIN